MMNPEEQRIREFAYQIWLSEGKPHGHAKRHWEMASKLAKSQAEGESLTIDTLEQPKAKRSNKKVVDSIEVSALAKPPKKAKAPAAENLSAEKNVKVKTSEKNVEAATKKPAAAAKKNTVIENQPI